MKVAIIADTHDHMRLLSRVVSYLNEVKIDLLIHCGDWDMPFTMRAVSKAKFPIRSVLGNGDPDIQKFQYQLQNLPILKGLSLDIQPEMQDFVIDGKRVCVFHGDDDNTIKLIKETQFFDLFCVGHNHTYSVEQIGKTLVVNPGSFIGYKEETGPEPAHMVIYDTTNNKTETVLIEGLS